MWGFSPSASSGQPGSSSGLQRAQRETGGGKQRPLGSVSYLVSGARVVMGTGQPSV